MADDFDPQEFSSFKANAENQFDPNEFSAFKQQPNAQANPAPTSWGDVGSQALSNLPSSAGRFASDIVQPVIHPIDTATSLKNLGLGV